MDVNELVASSESKIDRLRGQIESEERFLTELRKRVPKTTETVRTVQELPPRLIEQVDRLRVEDARVQIEMAPAATEGRHATRGEKTDIARKAIRARPGEWKASLLDAIYRQRGINPKAGTPSKNILWNLAKEGEMVALGDGVYTSVPSGPEATQLHPEGGRV